MKSLFGQKRIASAVFLCIACLALPAVSAPSDIDEKVERIQKAYEKISDMRGSFIQKNIIKDLNKTDSYAGEFFIRQPLKMKWVYTGKAAQDVYINDKTVLIYKRGDSQAYQAAFDKTAFGQTPVALLSGFGNIRQEFSISGKGDTLLLKPKSSLGSITSISIRLSEDEFPIVSFTIRDSRSNVVEIRLKKVRINTGFKDSLFEFSLPKGVNIYEYNP